MSHSPSLPFPGNEAQQRLRRVWAISWTIKAAAAIVLIAVLLKFTGGI